MHEELLVRTRNIAQGARRQKNTRVHALSESGAASERGGRVAARWRLEENSGMSEAQWAEAKRPFNKALRNGSNGKHSHSSSSCIRAVWQSRP
eukprot:1339001-Pleurochrysis_carterae.AAC.2